MKNARLRGFEYEDALSGSRRPLTLREMTELAGAIKHLRDCVKLADALLQGVVSLRHGTNTAQAGSHRVPVLGGNEEKVRRTYG